MTPRERNDMKYIVGVAIALIVIGLLYIGWQANEHP
jgi:hypothetical protein